MLPSFADTHRHVRQSVLHAVAVDSDPGNPLATLECLDGGITTVQDFSHVRHMRHRAAHGTAAVHGLRAAGTRAVSGYSYPPFNPATHNPQHVRNLLKRAGLRLALIAALQYLPPRQRAVLILRNVPALRAAEVAALLGFSAPVAKSTLQRARTRPGRVAPSQDDTFEVFGARERELPDRCVAAFETAHDNALTALLPRTPSSKCRPLPRGSPVASPSPDAWRPGFPPRRAPSGWSRPRRMAGPLPRCTSAARTASTTNTR
ncbi:hypothetical protein B4N89_32865 [Embleya scabrispora]|uniref:RNA polymerase sigma factor 70 region 4 type 2 domain-containing protein n=1 Tax=Embleya scabrispora TaxID=159449 RepID=A0A1T3NPS7_9ACTN|nr:sigma factor-like helix-turn-helix DNA-binding protein [Embleya scabrispora]OPC78913.1 hypothetical protein B4N89_32865 [Embleya scabrispora]